MIIRNQYTISTIAKGIREDGRKLEEFRDIRVEVNPIPNAEGSARVWMGKTDVLVGVKIGVGEPFQDKSDEGILISNAELSPMAHPDFESGPPGEKSIELARIIDRGIRESKAIDMKKLCIKAGEKVWMVNIDLQIMNHDGNLIDACSLATMAALSNAMIPEYDESTGKINTDNRTVKLPLLDQAIAVTVYKIGSKLVVDPTDIEEQAVTSRLTVATTSEGQICALQKGGVEPLSFGEIKECFRISLETGEQLRKLI
jgi:exosome complex component RRP42